MEDLLGIMFLWYVGLWGSKKYLGLTLLCGISIAATFLCGDSSSNLMTSLNIAGWIFSFLIAPFLTVVGALWLWVPVILSSHEPPTVAMLTELKLGIFVWGALKLIGFAVKKQAEARENAMQLERQRIEREAESQRLSEVRRENKATLTELSSFVKVSRKPIRELQRTAKALGNTDTEHLVAEQITLHDVARILVSFRDTDCVEEGYIEGLWEVIDELLYVEDSDYDIQALEDMDNVGVNLPEMVKLLAHYDTLQETAFASKAVSAYLSLVATVVSHCEDSMSVKMVADSYGHLLEPYAKEERPKGPRAGSSTPRKRKAKGLECPLCASAFETVGLAVTASEDDVRKKRRAWAEVLHPDQLSNKSEGARTAGEEQLKNINAACDHIFQCRFSATSS